MHNRFSIFIFCSAITYGDVSYDYKPETFATSEKQSKSFALEKERGKSNIGSNKVVLPHAFCVLTFLTLFNNKSSVQIKFISGDSFNFTFFSGGIFYQMCLANVFLCVFIKFSTRIKSNFSSYRQDN